jgi:hypothetical protein
MKTRAGVESPPETPMQALFIGQTYIDVTTLAHGFDLA